MEKKRIRGAALAAVFAAGILAGGAGMYFAQSLSPQNRKLEEIKNVIDDKYLFGSAPRSDEDWIYSGLMGSLGDLYAKYYSKAAYQEFQDENNGNYVGIGAVVSEKTATGEKTVVHCYEGGPAALAGIREGDQLKEAGGVSAEELALDDLVADYIKGEAGTSIVIKVYRPDTDETLEFTVERGEVTMRTVGSRTLEGGVGYIRVVQFLESTADEFVNAVDGLGAVTSLVIDLRDNPGGSLDAVSKMADYLIEDGLTENARCFGRSTLTYTLNKSGNSVTFMAGDGHSVEAPIVVLMNENSASASELFAGALRDSGKALILGTNSYGKGIVQSAVPLSDGSAVKLTVSQYYTPGGFALHGVGLAPDVELERDEPLTQSQGYISEDALNALSTDNQTAGALGILAEILDGKKTLRVSEGGPLEVPAAFTELTGSKTCSGAHFDWTEEQAEALLPGLADAQGLRLFICEDDWNTDDGHGFEHERIVSLLNHEDGEAGGSVCYGADPSDGRLHWFSAEDMKAEAAAAVTADFLRNALKLSEDESAKAEEKLRAVNTENGSYSLSGRGFKLKAAGRDGKLTVTLYPKK